MKIEGHGRRSLSLLGLLVEYSLLTTIATVQLLPSIVWISYILIRNDVFIKLTLIPWL